MADKFLTGSVDVSTIDVGDGRDSSTDVAPVQFNPENYANLIKSHGVPVVWEKSMLCPSRTNAVKPGGHDPTCKLCDGSGYVFFEPINTIMVIQSASLEQNYYIQGRFDSGTATITALPENKISYWDRIVLPNTVMRYTDLVFRRVGTLTDPVRYSVVELLRVQSGPQVFEIGKDFKLKDGQIVWTKNAKRRPADGVSYSILGNRNPVYLVMDMLNPHRQVRNFSESDGMRDMPLRATVKLDFLIKDDSLDLPEAIAKTPFSK